MARELTLTIRRDGTDYTYGPDRLLVELGTLDKRVNDLTIEMEDLPLVVGPDQNGIPELFGITGPMALPEGTFRAKIEDASGTTLMNGGIVASDATYEQNTKAWNLRLIDQASADFFSLLEGRFFETDGSQAELRTFDASGSNLGREAGGFGIGLVQVRSALNQIFTEIGATYSMPARLWKYEIQYSTGTIQRDSKDVYISRGGKDDRTIVEEITKLAGWRMDVQYQGWPSEDFHVEMQPTGWPEPGADRVLDGEEDQDGYEITMERAGENWALELRGGVDRSSPDVRAQSPGPGGFGAYAVPPMWGTFAPEQWSAAPPDIVLNTKNLLSNEEVDQRKTFADPVSSDFKVPEIYPKEIVDDGVEVEVHGLPSFGFDEPAENQLVSRTSRELYIVELGKENPNTNTGRYYALYGRHPSSGKWDEFGRRAYSAAWASIPYEQQAFRRATLREAVGKWIGAGNVKIGDVTTTVELLGEEWLPTEKRANIDKDRAELVLKRPIATTTTPAQPSRPATDSEWTVITPRGRYRTVDRGSGDEDWILLHWERTPTQEATEIYYHAQYRDNDGDGTWKDFTQAGQPKIYATAATLIFKTAGNGGASSVDIDARVRPVEQPGSVGGWRQFSVNT